MYINMNKCTILNGESSLAYPLIYTSVKSIDLLKQMLIGLYLSQGMYVNNMFNCICLFDKLVLPLLKR